MAREIHQKELKDAWNAINEERARMHDIVQFQEEQIRLDVGGMCCGGNKKKKYHSYDSYFYSLTQEHHTQHHSLY